MDNILNSTVEMSQAELILQLAQTNVEQEKRLKLTEQRLGWILLQECMLLNMGIEKRTTVYVVELR